MLGEECTCLVLQQLVIYIVEEKDEMYNAKVTKL